MPPSLESLVSTYFSQYSINEDDINFAQRPYLKHLAAVARDGQDPAKLLLQFDAAVATLGNDAPADAHGGVRDFARTMLAYCGQRPRISFDDASDLFNSTVMSKNPVTVSMRFEGQDSQTGADSVRDASIVYEALNQVVAMNRGHPAKAGSRAVSARRP